MAEDPIPTEAGEAGWFDLRRYAVNIGYRMTGSRADAEDIAQETMLRLHRFTQNESPREPKALVATIAARLGVDALRDRNKREAARRGSWLPEPLLSEADFMAQGTAEPTAYDDLSYAFLTLLETLTPFERAVFLLKETFAYRHSEIADMLGRDEAACRKALSRAKTRIRERRSRFEADTEGQHRLLRAFMDCARRGDFDGLLGLLREDIILWTDGGEAGPATPHPLVGAERVAQFALGAGKLTPAGAHYAIETLHGGPALVARKSGTPVFVLIAEFEGSRISGLFALSDPAKLDGLAP